MKYVLNDSNLCYGCSACYSACPVSAITMIENEEGFLEPKINHEYCINCEVCRRICPRLNCVKKNEPQIVYAAKYKDPSIRMASQSGGAFWALCEYVVGLHGVVYGCVFDIADRKAKHIRVTSLDTATEMHGSKYIQSCLLETFRNVKRDLLDSKRVLFVGTPCQIAGLLSFLGKKHANLITVDLLCHCVASPLIWKEYVEQIEYLYRGRCIKVNFRDKKYGWGTHFETFLIKKDTKVKFLKEGTFARLFNSGLISRESCFSCQFKTKERVGDFTIGDCGGIKRTSKEFWDRKGVSLIMINNTQLDEACTFMYEKLECRSVDLCNVLQPALFKSIERNPQKDSFWNLYAKRGISGIVNSFGSIELRIRQLFWR